MRWNLERTRQSLFVGTETAARRLRPIALIVALASTPSFLACAGGILGLDDPTCGPSAFEDHGDYLDCLLEETGRD